jgi:hypothetical protein
MRAPGQRLRRWRWLASVASAVTLSVPLIVNALGAPSLPASTSPAMSAESDPDESADPRPEPSPIWKPHVNHAHVLAYTRVVAANTQPIGEAPRPEESAPAAAPDPLAGRTVWDDLADCESGDWDDGVPQTGTARWDYGLTFDHGDIFEGGLNFHPATWDEFKDPGMPDHAGHASRAHQIVIGERVLAAQGWGAWPVCSRKLGLR